jgi:hypothetical protein
MDPGPFFYIVITVYHLLALFTFLQITIFYHSIHLILCLQQTGEIDNLTVSWGKVLGYVVCRFHVAVGAKLRPGRGAIYKLSGAIAKLASINLRKLVLSPTGSINLGFILRKDLLLCSSYLPLGVPNWAVIYTPSMMFLCLLPIVVIMIGKSTLLLILKNLFGTNSKNVDVNNCCTISAIHVPSNDNMFTNEHPLEDSYYIAYDDYNDEYDILSPPTIEEKTRYDYNMPPIFDDYCDENNYFVEFAPTTITKNNYVHVGSINSFTHMAHDKNVLCDNYIVNSIHDATESYYERGKHGFMDLNTIKFPLFMLKFLKLHLFCFPMLVALCFHDLFLYKTLFHRKWFRFKFVSHLLFDALSCFKSFQALI